MIRTLSTSISSRSAIPKSIVEKAKRWMNIPLPQVDVDHLKLDITPNDPRIYLQTMYELIYLAFKTDSTRVATYQLGRENGVGISDYLARAIGFNLTSPTFARDQKTGWMEKLRLVLSFHQRRIWAVCNASQRGLPKRPAMATCSTIRFSFWDPPPARSNLSRNYPLILTGGNKLGFKHGQFFARRRRVTRQITTG